MYLSVACMYYKCVAVDYILFSARLTDLNLHSTTQAVWPKPTLPQFSHLQHEDSFHLKWLLGKIKVCVCVHVHACIVVAIGKKVYTLTLEWYNVDIIKELFKCQRGMKETHKRYFSTLGPVIAELLPLQIWKLQGNVQWLQQLRLYRVV